MKDVSPGLERHLRNRSDSHNTQVRGATRAAIRLEPLSLERCDNVTIQLVGRIVGPYFWSQWAFKFPELKLLSNSHVLSSIATVFSVSEKTCIIGHVSWRNAQQK